MILKCHHHHCTSWSFSGPISIVKSTKYFKRHIDSDLRCHNRYWIFDKHSEKNKLPPLPKAASKDMCTLKISAFWSSGLMLLYIKCRIIRWGGTFSGVCKPFQSLKITCFTYCVWCEEVTSHQLMSFLFREFCDTGRSTSTISKCVERKFRHVFNTVIRRTIINLFYTPPYMNHSSLILYRVSQTPPPHYINFKSTRSIQKRFGAFC